MVACFRVWKKERVMQWWVWMLGICSDSTLATSGVPGPPLIRWYSQTAGNLCAYLSYAVSSRLIGWLVTGGGAEPGARPITAGGNRPITERGAAAWVLGSMYVLLFCDTPKVDASKWKYLWEAVHLLFQLCTYLSSCMNLHATCRDSYTVYRVLQKKCKSLYIYFWCYNNEVADGLSEYDARWE